MNQDLNFSLQANPRADVNSLQPVGTWLISNGSAKGIAGGGGHFANPIGSVYAITGVAPGSAAFIVIKAWTGNYDSIASAVAAGQFVGGVGFWNPTGGGGTAASSLVATPAVNMPGIPEPSPLALLAGGAVAVLA